MKEIYKQSQINKIAAMSLVNNAIKKAEEINVDICAAVVDCSGHIVAVLRSDSVVRPAIEYAIDKAYTAGTLGVTTEAFFNRAKSKPALAMGLTNRSRVLVFPGGLPIKLNGELLGGLGVSGAQDDEDVMIAKNAIIETGFDRV